MSDALTMVCAGEALTDMIHGGNEQWVSRVGGSTWNVARALAALGEPTGFAGAISNDRFGDALWKASMDANLDLRLLQRVDRSPLLAIVESEPPSYFFIGEDSADLHFDPAKLPEGWMDGLRWAHFGGISLARQPLAARLVELARTLKRRGVKISFDPNFRNLMDTAYTPTLAAMATLADLIKVSDDDLRGLFPGLELDAALSTIRAFNPDALCLFTRGGQGASLYLHDQRVDARAPRIAVVDTVGAGDASAAGLLHSLAQNPQRTLQSHLHAALAAGSAACLHAGATPPQSAVMHQLFESLEGDVS
jgi:fructokinase